MDEIQQKCLEIFPEWLAGLVGDAKALLLVIGDESCPDVHRRWAAAALNYLLKSIDLIPDGVEDLGFIDDAFVLRVACGRAVNAVPIEGERSDSVVAKLAGETEIVESYLGELYSRLSAYVASLAHSTVRGRTVEQIVAEPEIREQLAQDVEAWASVFEPPSFAQDEKILVKLAAFMGAKLP